MLKQTALVIGASGLIGSHLQRLGQARGWDLTGTWYSHSVPGLVYLDATDIDAVRSLVRRLSPAWILLPAANPNVELCEREPAATARVNVGAVANVATVAAETGSRVAYFSSDYVFDGEAGPYRETDQLNPISEYGRQKRESEQLLARLLPGRHLILRVTVVYGADRLQKDFISRLRQTLARGERLRVPEDQIGSPTFVDDIADATWDLIAGNETGIFHVAGPDLMNRYEFALLAARIFGLPEASIEPVLTAALDQKAARPLRAGMVSAKLEERIGRRLRTPFEGLSDLKEQYSAGVQAQ